LKEGRFIQLTHGSGKVVVKTKGRFFLVTYEGQDKYSKFVKKEAYGSG
jgi:hypothetical protein